MAIDVDERLLVHKDQVTRFGVFTAAIGQHLGHHGIDCLARVVFECDNRLDAGPRIGNGPIRRRLDRTGHAEDTEVSPLSLLGTKQ